MFVQGKGDEVMNSNSSTSKEVVLTYEGLEQLEQELEELKVVRRKEVAEKIKQALAFGDLSENSEYDEAKNEQAQIETRIVLIESMLKRARVIDEDDINTDIVNIGAKVSIQNVATKQEMQYTIVGPTEANPSKAKLSFESPVGKALIGQQKGSIVEIAVPSGTVKYKIVDISK